MSDAEVAAMDASEKFETLTKQAASLEDCRNKSLQVCSISLDETFGYEL